MDTYRRDPEVPDWDWTSQTAEHLVRQVRDARDYAERWETALTAVDAAWCLTLRNNVMYVCEEGDVKYFLIYNHGESLCITVASKADHAPVTENLLVPFAKGKEQQCKEVMAAFLLCHPHAHILFSAMALPVLLYSGSEGRGEARPFTLSAFESLKQSGATHMSVRVTPPPPSPPSGADGDQ